MSKPERDGLKIPFASTLPSLATFIESDHRGNDWISFPQGTEENIKVYRRLNTQFPKVEIQQLARALDIHKYHFCSRLDELSLMVLCSIVTFSEACGARYRGYQLIAEAIHPNPSESQTLRDHKYTNKCALGNSLPRLLEGLTRSTEQEEPRRWMSVLVLELLEGCPENLQSLKSYQSAVWRGLIQTVKHCKGEILRILTGLIVGQMLSGGVKTDMLWSKEDADEWLSEYPVMRQQNTRWLNRFQDHIRPIVARNVSPGKPVRARIPFARAATIGEHRYAINDESAIFVDVSKKLLQIFVKASSTDLATQIDIPLLNISSEEIAKATSVNLKDTVYSTRIRLSASVDAPPLFLNANDWNDTDVEISFESEHAASILYRLIRALKATAQKEAKAEKAAKDSRGRVPEKMKENLKIAQRPKQAIGVALQNSDDDDYIADEQWSHPGSPHQETSGQEMAEVTSIAVQATSFLAFSQQQSGSAQHQISSITQGIPQRQAWLGLKRLQSNDTAIQGPLESLEHTEGAGVEIRLSAASEISKIPPQAQRASNEIESQSSKRQKLSRRLYADEKSGSKPSQHEENRQGGGTAPRLTASKPLSSGLPARSNTNLPSSSRRAGSRVQHNGQNEQLQLENTDIPDQDPYDIPASPVPPPRTITSQSRVDQPAARRSSKSGKRSDAGANKSSHKKSSKKKNVHIRDSQLPAKPRSRRAAAIRANEKIGVIDNSPLPSSAEAGSEDIKGTREMHDRNEMVSVEADRTTHDDSIETVNASMVIPVAKNFVQDSIETADNTVFACKRPLQDSIESAKDICEKVTTKKPLPVSVEIRDSADPSIGDQDNETGKRTVDSEQKTHVQTVEVPETFNDEKNLTLTLAEERLDSSREDQLKRASPDGKRSSNENETNQHDSQGGLTNGVSRLQKNQGSNLIAQTPVDLLAQNVEPSRRMGNEEVLNENSSKDRGPTSIFKQKGEKSAIPTSPKGDNNASKNVQRDDVSTPKPAGDPKLDDSLNSRDPFSAKLTKVVEGEEMTARDHAALVVNARKVQDGNNISKSTPAKTLQRSLLQAGQRNVPVSDIQNLDYHPQSPGQRPKRKVGGASKKSNKKSRMNSHKVDDTAEISLRNTPPIASRKTAIISFSTSGPRNQGTANKQNSRKPKTLTNDLKIPQLSGTVENAAVGSEVASVGVVPLIELQNPISRKADVLEFDDGHAAFEDEKANTSVNDEGRATEPQIHLTQHGKADVHDIKPSNSQTTRVNHNGSPMPIRHPTNEPAPVPVGSWRSVEKDQLRQREQQLSNNEEAFSSDSEDDVLCDDEHQDNGDIYQDDPEPALPSRNAVSQASMPQPDALNWVNISKNTKQIPSSPHEPSATTALPAHHVHHGGQIINTSTNEPVVPSNPKDPFVAQAAKPSSFVRLLHQANDNYAKQQADAAAREQPKKSRILMIHSADDPEKTRVESSRSRRKIKFDESSSASSSPSSEDTNEEDASRTLVEETVEDTPTQWKKALLPHQQDTLEVLGQISHRLLAHMNQGEESILDLIQDFKKSGNKLIDHLEQDVKKAVVARATATATVEKKVIDAYQNTMADLKASEEQLVGRTHQVEADLNAHHRSLLSSIDDALALWKY